MKLVGASNWFVRGPFMLEGCFTGFSGAACGRPALDRQRRRDTLDLRRVDADSEVQALSFAWTAFILLALGLLLGAAGSGLSATPFPAGVGTRSYANARNKSSVPASQPMRVRRGTTALKIADW